MVKNKVSLKPGALLAPLPTVLVSCSDKGEDNVFTVAWTGIINSNPPMTYVSIRPERHSYDMVMNSKEFVINLVDEDLVYAMDYCGNRSGANENKFETMHLTKLKSDKVSCPFIGESPMSLECKVTETKTFGSHTMFIADIVAIHVNEDLLKEDGRLAIEDANLVCLLHSKYLGLHKHFSGIMGYSVMKPETAKRRRKEGKPVGGNRPHFKKKQ